MRLLQALRRPGIRWLWLGQIFSGIGDQVYEIGLVWMTVGMLGANAGYLSAAGTGAWLACSLAGGVMADRWPRVRTMVAADVIRGVTVLLLPVAFWLGWLNVGCFVAVAIVLGAFSALFYPAMQGSLRAFAGEPELLRATNGLMDATRRLARILGPLVASGLLALVPLVQFATFNALSFFASALAIVIAGRHLSVLADENGESTVPSGERSIRRELSEAIRLMHGHALMRTALVTRFLANFTWSICFILGLALLTKQELGGDVNTLGLLLGAYGVTNLLGNVVSGSFSGVHPARQLFGGEALYGFGTILLGLAPNVPLAMCAVAVAAFGPPMATITQTTLIQTEFPASHVGKIYSLFSAVELGGGFIGYLCAPMLCAALGLRGAMLTCGGAALCAAGAALLVFRQIEKRKMLQSA